MHIQNIFPVSIGHFNDTTFTNKVLPIANSILDESQISSLGYKNTYNNHRGQKYLKSFTWIEDYIHQICYEYINKLKIKFKDKIYIDTLFVSKINNTQFHGRHTHPNSILSGVIYLDTIGVYAPIIFDDPCEVRNFHSLNSKNENNIEGIPFYPTKGDIIVFESWLPHRVPHNVSKEAKEGSRTTLVFNVSSKNNLK
tara:strand:+ start:842 stop:1432 length:591 start_codon:yes stop_codon:yes gene_type:complete